VIYRNKNVYILYLLILQGEGLKMKKSLLWMVVLVLGISMVATFTLAGCEKAGAAVEEAVEEVTEAEEEAVTEEEEAVVEEVTGAAEGIVIYAQMGGVAGDPSTLPRQNGAAAAAEQWGCEVVYQFSEWQPDKMIAQFKEAIAAEPDGIIIMGHPGVDAFRTSVEEAEGKGIIVTANNTPLPEFETTYGGNGFGYAGADLFEGGYVTGQQIIAAGNLQAGDRVLEYGLRAQPERGKSDEGVYQAFLDAGLEVDYIEITSEVDADASLCIPILTGYLASNPDCKAIGTQHGNVTSTMAEVVTAAGLGPDDIVIGGIDLSPKTVEALQDGYVDLVLDQVLYLQGYLPVTQICLTKLYGIPGLHINTASGVVTSDSITNILDLIDEGIR